MYLHIDVIGKGLADISMASPNIYESDSHPLPFARDLRNLRAHVALTKPHATQLPYNEGDAAWTVGKHSGIQPTGGRPRVNRMFHEVKGPFSRFGHAWAIVLPSRTGMQARPQDRPAPSAATGGSPYPTVAASTDSIYNGRRKRT